jgi:hypothetical protein
LKPRVWLPADVCAFENWMLIKNAAIRIKSLFMVLFGLCELPERQKNLLISSRNEEIAIFELYIF